MDKRIYGLDYLKIILMIMICILHILNQGGMLESIPNNSYLYYIYYFIEIICINAVNCYVIISGYLNLNKKIKFTKLIPIWLQVLFYSVIVSYILYLLRLTNLDIRFYKQFMPITNKVYWFATAYFALYLIMPYINKMIKSLTIKESKTLLIIILILSIIEYFSNILYLNAGYSFIWLTMLYTIGTILRKTNILKKIKTHNLLIIFIINCIISLIIMKITNKTTIILNYNSPINTINSIILVTIFTRINKKHNIYIISKYSLGVYLFQCNYIIWDMLYKKYSINNNILTLIKATLTLFFIGLIIDYIRDKLFKLLKFNEIYDNIYKNIKNKL